jgi:hypothetical protein
MVAAIQVLRPAAFSMVQVINSAPNFGLQSQDTNSGVEGFFGTTTISPATVDVGMGTQNSGGALMFFRNNVAKMRLAEGLMVASDLTTDPGAGHIRADQFDFTTSSPSAVTCDAATVNTVTLTISNVILLSGAGLSSCFIGGFTGGIQGRVIFVIIPDSTTYNTTWVRESGSVTAANRIGGTGGAGLTVGYDAAIFIYGSDSRWHQVKVS